MTILSFGRYALSGVAVAILAGCGDHSRRSARRARCRKRRRLRQAPTAPIIQTLIPAKGYK
jgi:hypothetical protein